MPRFKAILWRIVWAVVVIAVLLFVVPLLFEMVGFSLPMGGPAITLLKFALGCLVVIYVFFGPEPYALF